MNITATIYSELEVSVGVPATGLKGAMNIGKLESVFLVVYVASRLALNLVFVENMLVDIM